MNEDIQLQLDRTDRFASKFIDFEPDFNFVGEGEDEYEYEEEEYDDEGEGEESGGEDDPHAKELAEKLAADTAVKSAKAQKKAAEKAKKAEQARQRRERAKTQTQETKAAASKFKILKEIPAKFFGVPEEDDWDY